MALTYLYLCIYYFLGFEYSVKLFFSTQFLSILQRLSLKLILEVLSISTCPLHFPLCSHNICVQLITFFIPSLCYFIYEATCLFLLPNLWAPLGQVHRAQLFVIHIFTPTCNAVLRTSQIRQMSKMWGLGKEDFSGAENFIFSRFVNCNIYTAPCRLLSVTVICFEWLVLISMNLEADSPLMGLGLKTSLSWHPQSFGWRSWVSSPVDQLLDFCMRYSSAH